MLLRILASLGTATGYAERKHRKPYAPVLSSCVEMKQSGAECVWKVKRKRGEEFVTVLYGVKGEDGRRLAWPLLAWAVQDCWGWPALPPVKRSPRGKPFFPGGENRWFSLSHSGGMALCALSDDGPVGADVELARPRRAGLPAYALSPAELARFDGSWEEFFRLWTLKESWCKREDAPLFPPRAVETPPACPHGSYGGTDWRAAVCCSGSPPEEIRWVGEGALINS